MCTKETKVLSLEIPGDSAVTGMIWCTALTTSGLLVRAEARSYCSFFTFCPVRVSSQVSSHL